MMKALPTIHSMALTLTVLGAGLALTDSAQAGPINVPIQGTWVASANGPANPNGPQLVLTIYGGDQWVQPGVVSGRFMLSVQNLGQTINQAGGGYTFQYTGPQSGILILTGDNGQQIPVYESEPNAQRMVLSVGGQTLMFQKAG
jgi:hypothetical protein